MGIEKIKITLASEVLLFQALSCANIFSISSSSEFLALVEVPILPVLTDGALAS
jgi:hypothetical protein